jgi:L-fucono-1,5-lactonase
MSEASDVIDAHHHFWGAGQHARSLWAAPLFQQAFGPDDLVPQLEQAGVAGTILVQSMNDQQENKRLLDFADAAPFVRGIVSWLPWTDPAAAVSQLNDLTQAPLIRGVRWLVGRDSLSALTGAQGLDLLARVAGYGLCWEVVPVTDGQIEEIAVIARKLPELRIVVDHLARPPLESGDWERWRQRIAVLARLPNVAMKMSIGVDVLESWASWSAGPLPACIEWAITRFGSQRLMAASNWPVVTMRASYCQVWATWRQVLAGLGLDRSAQAAVLGGSAAAWYSLPDERYSSRRLLMNVVIGADHAGFPAKESVRSFLLEDGHDVTDVGTTSTEPVDFPDIALVLARTVLSGRAERGIMVCGTGVGACMAANKIPGIRAALAHDLYSAHQCVEHDDANVLCIGAQIIGPVMMQEVIHSFLDAKWSLDEQFHRRVGKLADLEKGQL